MSKLFLSRYLPPGVEYDDLSEEDLAELVDIYDACEVKRDKYFDKLVSEAYKRFFDRRSVAEVAAYLPQKPHPITLDDLPPQVRAKVIEAVNDGIKRKVTKKTLRKRIRRIIDEG